jgi:hypothetical protein
VELRSSGRRGFPKDAIRGLWGEQRARATQASQLQQGLGAIFSGVDLQKRLVGGLGKGKMRGKGGKMVFR